jgi:hypothetical protein
MNRSRHTRGDFLLDPQMFKRFSDNFRALLGVLVAGYGVLWLVSATARHFF